MIIVSFSATLSIICLELVISACDCLSHIRVIVFFRVITINSLLCVSEREKDRDREMKIDAAG